VGAAFRFFVFFPFFFLFFRFPFVFFRFFFEFEVDGEGPGEGFRVGLCRRRDPDDGKQRHDQDDECHGGEAAPALRPAREFAPVRHPYLNRQGCAFP
jgi:hypothetical protein